MKKEENKQVSDAELFELLERIGAKEIKYPPGTFHYATEKNEEGGLDPREVRKRLLERFEREGIKIVTSNPAYKSRVWVEIKSSRK